jgi:hypothetical protein
MFRNLYGSHCTVQWEPNIFTKHLILFLFFRILVVGAAGEKITRTQIKNPVNWDDLSNQRTTRPSIRYKHVFECQQHKGNWGQNLPPVSLIPAAICHWCIDTCGKFATGVVDTGGAP